MMYIKPGDILTLNINLPYLLQTFYGGLIEVIQKSGVIINEVVIHQIDHVIPNVDYRYMDSYHEFTHPLLKTFLSTLSNYAQKISLHNLPMRGKEPINLALDILLELKCSELTIFSQEVDSYYVGSQLHNLMAQNKYISKYDFSYFDYKNLKYMSKSIIDGCVSNPKLTVTYLSPTLDSSNIEELKDFVKFSQIRIESRKYNHIKCLSKLAHHMVNDFKMHGSQGDSVELPTLPMEVVGLIMDFVKSLEFPKQASYFQIVPGSEEALMDSITFQPTNNNPQHHKISYPKAAWPDSLPASSYKKIYELGWQDFLSSMKNVMLGDTITLDINLSYLSKYYYSGLIEIIEKSKVIIDEVRIHNLSDIMINTPRDNFTSNRCTFDEVMPYRENICDALEEFLSTLSSNAKKVVITGLPFSYESSTILTFSLLQELKCNELTVSADSMIPKYVGNRLSYVIQNKHISKLDISSLCPKALVSMQESIIEGCKANPRLEVKYSDNPCSFEQSPFKLLFKFSKDRTLEHVNTYIEFINKNHSIINEKTLKVCGSPVPKNSIFLPQFPEEVAKYVKLDHFLNPSICFSAKLDGMHIPTGDKAIFNGMEDILIDDLVFLGGLTLLDDTI